MGAEQNNNQTNTHTHARRRLLKGLRYRRGARRGLSEPWLWGQAPDSSAGSSRERPQEELNYRVLNYFGSNWFLVINRSKRRNSFPRCQGRSCRESPAVPLPAQLQAGLGVSRGATAPRVLHGVCPKRQNTSTSAWGAGSEPLSREFKLRAFL